MEKKISAAKSRASRANIMKAIEKRKEQALQKRFIGLATSIKSLEDKVAEAKELVPALSEEAIKSALQDAAARAIAKIGKRSLREMVKDAAWGAWEGAGGQMRLEKLLKGDDAAFLRFPKDVLVPLSKSDDGDTGSRPVVRVNIIGAPGGDVNVAMRLPEDPAVLDYQVDL